MPLTSPTVIGKFSGKCADAGVFNNNQMQLNRKLFENLFSSEDYQTALKNRWYIGFLGHPEDPNCMDFKDACIVMTESHLEDNDDVYGEFDLIDTPVGRVVKSFQDAGVKFGISIRGAGDVSADGEVDPDTFVFRGYDLVTFPAYNDAIPTFQEIAAATDLASQVKYKKVCASINAELENITSIQALTMLQSQFSSKSSEYAAIDARKKKITCSSDESIADQQVERLTKLYLDKVACCKELEARVAELSANIEAVECSYRRKFSSIRRITASKLAAAKKEIEATQLTGKTLNRANEELKSENLKYRRKIQSQTELLSEQQRSLSSVQEKLHETVIENSSLKKKASNRDAESRSLKDRVTAAESMLAKFQSAYANMLASAVGVDLGSISITANTTVEDIQKAVYGSTVPFSADVADIEILSDDFNIEHNLTTL